MNFYQSTLAFAGVIQSFPRYGIEVFSGSLFDFKDLSQYDVVVLQSVAEHIDDILQLLLYLKNNCTNTTMLVFGQAIYDGLVPRLLRGFWYGWSPDEHYWHFTQKSFEHLLKLGGFSVIETVRRPLIHDFYFGLKLKRFVFLNSVAILNLVARLLGKEDHAHFFVTITPQNNLP